VCVIFEVGTEAEEIVSRRAYNTYNLAKADVNTPIDGIKFSFALIVKKLRGGADKSLA
jgi:hypothetical protein